MEVDCIGYNKRRDIGTLTGEDVANLTAKIQSEKFNVIE